MNFIPGQHLTDAKYSQDFGVTSRKQKPAAVLPRVSQVSVGLAFG
jgi:hypothetical protein